MNVHVDCQGVEIFPTVYVKRLAPWIHFVGKWGLKEARTQSPWSAWHIWALFQEPAENAPSKLASSQVIPQTSSSQSRQRKRSSHVTILPRTPVNSTLHTTGTWKANYPAGASLSPGEPRTGRGAPHGFPQMPPLLCGSATNRHTLLCSGPVEIHCWVLHWCCAWDGQVPVWNLMKKSLTHPPEGAPHSPSWQYTGYVGLPLHKGWGNSVFYSGSFSDVFLWRHLGQSTTRTNNNSPAEHPKKGLPVACHADYKSGANVIELKVSTLLL